MSKDAPVHQLEQGGGFSPLEAWCMELGCAVINSAVSGLDGYSVPSDKQLADIVRAAARRFPSTINTSWTPEQASSP